MASDFLRRKAAASAASVEKNVGKGAYGSTTYYEKKEEERKATAPKSYSDAVTMLRAQGDDYAAGIMTEHEWQRRRGKYGGTYQDYLYETTRKPEIYRRNIGFDTIDDDIAASSSMIDNAYNGWQDADTMSATKKQAESMKKRLSMYEEWRKEYGLGKGIDASGLLSYYESVLGDWDDLSAYYGQYGSKEQYESAKKAEQEMVEAYENFDPDKVLREIEERRKHLDKRYQELQEIIIVEGEGRGKDSPGQVALREQYDIQQELNDLDRQEQLCKDIKRSSNVVHKDDFWGQGKANYRLGDLGIKAGKARSRALDYDSAIAKETASVYAALENRYAKNNEAALDDEGQVLPWFSKNVAGYIPQLKDQAIPKYAGGAFGAAAGFAFGNVAGAKKGAAIGSGFFVGVNEYEVMRGSVYNELMQAGYDHDTSLAAANDEALISGLIEGASSGVDFFISGGGKLIDAIKGAAKASVAKGTAGAATKFIASNAAKKAAKEVSKPIWRKGVELGGRLFANTASEYGEEFLQQGVSIANKERLKAGNTGKGDLIGRTFGTVRDAVTGKNPKALSEMHEAGVAGAITGGLMGGAGTVTNMVVTRLANAKSVKKQNEIIDVILEDEDAFNALIEEGKACGEGTEAARIATELEGSFGKGVVSRDQVRRLIAANDVYIKNEEEAEAIRAEAKLEVTPLVDNKAEAAGVALQDDNIRTANDDMEEWSPSDEEFQKLLMKHQANTGLSKAGVRNSEAEFFDIGKLGENGKKQFEKFREEVGSDMTEEVLEGFSKFYEAGKNGLTLQQAHEANSYYLENFPKSVKGGGTALLNSAFYSGQNDRDVSDNVKAKETYKADASEKKSTGIVFEKALDDYTPEKKKTIQDYLGAVSQKILDVARRFKENKNSTFERVNLGKVGEREAGDIKRLTGNDASGYIHAINSNALNHIEKRHGENGEHDNSMADLNDVARIEYVLDNYDTVELNYDSSGNVITSGEFRGKDNKPAPLLLYSKKIDGTYYAVAAVSENKYKKIWAVTAFTAKSKEGITQALNAELSALSSTSETSLASLPSSERSSGDAESSINSISENGKDVKRKNDTADADDSPDIGDIKKATGFGDEGAQLVAELMSKGKSLEEAQKAVKPMYIAGFTGGDVKRAKTDIQKRAFDAGTSDKVAQREAARSKAKKATVRDGGLIENEASGKLSKVDREIIKTVAKDLGLSASVAEKIVVARKNGVEYEADARHRDGELTLTGARPVFRLVLHEAGHRMEQFATEEWNTLCEALYERAEQLGRRMDLGATDNLRFDRVKGLHDKAGITMDTSGYVGEVVMRELEMIFSSAEEYNKWLSEISSNTKVKSAWRKFMDFVSGLIGKVRNALKNAGLSKDARAQMKSELAEFERIRGLYADAYKATRDAVEQRRKDSDEARESDVVEETKFAIKNVGEDKVVYIDNDITLNKPENMKYTEYVEKYIAEMFDDNDYVSSLPDNGIPVFASDDLPGEFANSKYTKYLRNRKQDRFRAKMRLASSLEELVRIATGRRWEKAKHPNNKDVKYGVYKYSSSFAFPALDASGKTEKVFAYNCDIVVINASNGKKYLYDVQNIKENTELSEALTEREQKKDSFQKKETLKKRDTTTAGGIYKKESAGRQTSQLRSISDKSISQSNDIVKREFAISNSITSEQDTEYLELAKNPEKNEARLREMVEEAAKTNGYSVEAYHGTDKFGFTDIDVSKSDDEISFFATNDPEIAGTYTGSSVSGIRPINYNALDSDTIIDVIDSKIYGMKDRYKSIFAENATDALRDFEYGDIDEAQTVSILTEGIQKIGRRFDQKVSTTEIEDAVSLFKDGIMTSGVAWSRIVSIFDKLYDSIISEAESSLITSGDRYNADTKELVSFAKKVESALNIDEKGIYKFYCNTDNMLEIDAAGSFWNKINVSLKGTAKKEWTTRDLAKYAKAKNYSGVIIHNVVDSANLSVYRKSSDVFIFLEPGKQVKSADLVTYDDDGNIIPISERFNTEKNDIRHSIKEEGITSSEDTKELLNTIADLKHEFEITKFAKADPKKLSEMVRSILKDYSSKADSEAVMSAVDELYTYMANGEDGNPPVWSEVYSKALDIASGIVENAVKVDDTVYREYADLRNYLRNVPMKFDVRRDGVPSGYGNFNEFRKKNFGRLRFSNDGVSVDSVYQELAEMYPQFFDKDNEITTADQLERIVEVLDEIRPIEANPFAAETKEAARYLANDILDRFFNIRQTPTFSSEAERRSTEAKLKQIKEFNKTREQRDIKIQKLRNIYDSIIKNVNDEKTRALESQKAKHNESLAKMSESRRATEMRTRIFKHASELNQRLVRGTDNKHIPQELQGAVLILLESINLESNIEYVYGKDAMYHRVKRNTELGGESTKKTQAFNALRDIYSKLEGYVVIDPDMLGPDGILSEVINLADKRITDMTIPELNTVWKAIKAIEASVRSADKMFSAGKFRRVSDVAEGLRTDNADKSAKRDLRYGAGLQKLIGLYMLTPETYFHYLGDTGDQIFRMMRDAQDKHISIMKEVADFTHEAMEGVNIKKLEKELKTVKLGGKEVTLTTAQLMELYTLMKRNQAKEHVFVGGILPDTIKGHGLHDIKAVEPVTGISQAEILDALMLLTEDQRKLADKLQEYASTVLGKYGNEASMQVYNYEKFHEKNYWPIRTNKQEISTDIEKDTAVSTVANKGMAKVTVPDANTSLRIGSIFDTFASHASDMATYAAWLGTTEDINRIRNFVFWEDGVRTGSVKGILGKVHGSRGEKYLQNLLADISVGVKSTNTMNPFEKLMGNYKAASIGSNFRVIIQQPTAILRAVDMMGAQWFAPALVKNPLKGWDKAKKYAPIAQWKDWGYFDINTGRQMKDVLFDNASVGEKIKQFEMSGAGFADSLSWGALWNAVEAETKAKHKGLEVGSEAYYKAVAERFTEIADHTQVVDGILQRSWIMRSGDTGTKSATSFMGEPIKQYNMVASALYDFVNNRGKAKVQAAKRFGRMAIALAISCVVNSAAQSIIDAMRDDDKEKKYWERWLAAFPENLKDTVNVVNYIPFVKDVVAIIQGYDIERMDMVTIAKTYKACENMIKSLKGEGKNTILESSLNLFAELARLGGYSVSNIKRMVTSIADTFAIETDNYLMQYHMEKAVLDINFSGNRSSFIDILYNAYKNDREAYEIIYNDLIENGITEKQIQSGMETRMKKEAGTTKASELEKRHMSPDDERKYDGSLEEIKKSDVWEKANAGQRKKAEAALYDIIASPSDEMEKKRKEAAKYGVDETEYVLWELAKSIADDSNDDNNSLNAKEKGEAVGMIPGLGDSEIAYFYNTEEADEAYENGMDMRNYAEFKGAIAEIEGDDKRSAVVDKILEMGVDDDDAWDLYLSEYDNKNTDYARDNGIEGNTYLKFVATLCDVDKPTDSGKYGTYTQDEAKEAVNCMQGLTREEKAILWQSVNPQWKAKNNPFR